MKFLKFIKNDYPGLFCISITTAVIIFVIVSANKPEANMKLEIFLSVLSVLTLIIFIRRYLYLKKLFAVGIPATGTVTDTTFLRKNGSISFSYSYEGNEYSTKNSVSRNGLTKSFKKGDAVEIVIDPAKSSTAYIKKLFCEM